MDIFHITSASEWTSARAKCSYLPVNFARDGFIHCSFKDQVIPVANKFYRDMNELVLLKINSDLVTARIIEENLEGGEENFPHIYGQLLVNAVISFAPMTRNPNGDYTFPAQLA
jgi:uncharacterized protein (DUF952 family)